MAEEPQPEPETPDTNPFSLVPSLPEPPPEERRPEPQTPEQRDLDWLANVYRGDKEHDLTVRAIVAGMVFGGLMSVSNLYVGLKSGWGLDVGTAAIIVSFACFKAFQGMGLLRREFGMMECTMTMTVAVAASWISSAGLVSAVPALSLLRPDYHIVWWKLTLFIAVILYLGVIMAIPLKRQMIQVESLRFPGAIPSGETMKVMYSQGGGAMNKAVALGLGGVAGMLIAGLRDGLHLLPDVLKFPGRLYRVSLGKLTLGVEPGLIFIGVGAMVGMKVGLSMLMGFVLNYVVIAPILVNTKVVHHPPPMIKAGAAPEFPLSIKAGQSLSVQLDEATSEPELPTADEPKTRTKRDLPVTTKIVKYTWTGSKDYKYDNLQGLIDVLNAENLPSGKPNPFFGVVTGGTASKATGTNEFAEVLTFAATGASNWEARLSFPRQQAAGLPHALGFVLAGDKEAAQTAVENAAVGYATKAEAKKALENVVEKPLDEQNEAAMQKVGGFRSIVSWTLWPGATVLVVSGLLALAFQWRSLRKTFGTIFSGLGAAGKTARGPLDHVEVPMSWFIFGFLGVGLCTIVLLAWVFQVSWWMGAIAIVLSFFLAAAASRAGAETSINPISAMGKVTQLTFGIISPGNTPASLTTNLMTAGVTAGAACSCCDTVGNLKVGHMVGANPRRQLISQLFGVLAGSLLAVPVYFVLVPTPKVIGSDKFPAPSALVWKGVAEVLAKGLGNLPPGAVYAMIVALVVGVVIAVVDHLFPKLKPYTPSATALGIAMTIPASTSFAMFLGALIAWILKMKAPKWDETYTVPIASGCIAGESIMGVVVAALTAAGLVQ